MFEKLIRSNLFKTIIGIFCISLLFPPSVFSSSLPDDAPTFQLKHSWGKKGTETGDFNEPTGIALSDNEIYVSDARNARIQVFNFSGEFQRQFGNVGSKVEKLGRPMNLAIFNNEVYVADYFNDQIKIYTLAGKYSRSIGESGSGSGEFNAVAGIDIAKNGDLIVADFYNQRIQRLKPDGSFVRQWGDTGKTGIWSGKFNYPTDVALDKNDNLYVADGFNDRVQLFDAKGEYQLKWGGLFSMNVSGTRPGWFTTVTAIKIGFDGNVYVADFYNDRVQIFDPVGNLLNIIDVASNGIQHSSIAMAVAKDGSLFIVNHGKHEIQHWQK